MYEPNFSNNIYKLALVKKNKFHSSRLRIYGFFSDSRYKKGAAPESVRMKGAAQSRFSLKNPRDSLYLEIDTI